MRERSEGLSETNILTTKRRQGGRSATEKVPAPSATLVPRPSPPPPTPPQAPVPAELPTPEPETIQLAASDTDEDGPLPSHNSNASTKTFTGRKLYQHRLELPDRPLNDCAADSVHFSASASLVFTYMLLRDVVEGPDGNLMSGTLQCCICADKGTREGTYHVKDKTKKSTGSILYHFRHHHGAWWTKVEDMDNGVVPRPKKSATGKPVDVSIRLKC